MEGFFEGMKTSKYHSLFSLPSMEHHRGYLRPCSSSFCSQWTPKVFKNIGKSRNRESWWRRQQPRFHTQVVEFLAFGSTVVLASQTRLVAPRTDLRRRLFVFNVVSFGFIFFSFHGFTFPSPETLHSFETLFHYYGTDLHYCGTRRRNGGPLAMSGQKRAIYEKTNGKKFEYLNILRQN